MKNFLASVLFSTSLILCLASCGADTPPAVESEPAENAAAVEEQSCDSFTVQFKDLQSDLDQWHRFSIDVVNPTNQYLTTEIRWAMKDGSGNILGENTIFINNLGPAPADWASIPILAKRAPEYYPEYEIVSHHYTDGFEPAPDVTQDNVKEYLRMTYTDLGGTVGGNKEVSLDFYNLTPLYFSGTVNATVFDSSGQEIGSKMLDLQNIKPYGENGQLIFFPIVNEYSIEYSVSNFKVSNALIP